MNQFIVEEYARTLADEILSEKNTCGALQKAAEKRDSTYFEMMAIPVIGRLVLQLRKVEAERDRANSEKNQARFVLETFIQNHFSSREDSSILLIQKTEVLRKIVRDVLGRDALY